MHVGTTDHDNLMCYINLKWAKVGSLSLGWLVGTTDVIMSFDPHARQTDIRLFVESGLSFVGKPCLCFNNSGHPDVVAEAGNF